MKVLFVADIVGSCGMDIAEKYIRRLKKAEKIDAERTEVEWIAMPFPC